MNDTKHKYVFKIAVIGDGAVGKTSLIMKYTQESFQKEYLMTIGAQFSDYMIKIDGDKIKLVFWDIAGQDTHHYLRPAFYKGSHAAIIVFSLEESDHGRESLDHIKNWHNSFKQYCGELPIMLFGNKVDLVDEETLNDEKVTQIIEKRGFIGYYKTSAKTGEGVTDAFQVIIDDLYNKHREASCEPAT